MTRRTDRGSGAAAPEPGAPVPIPVEGSLGLLALGAVGLQAWRQVRDAARPPAPPPPAPAPDEHAAPSPGAGSPRL